MYRKYFVQLSAFSLLFAVGLAVTGAVGLLLQPFVASEDALYHAVARMGISALNAATAYFFALVFAAMIVFLNEARMGDHLTVRQALERGKAHVKSLFWVAIVFVLTLYGSLFTGVLFALFSLWYSFSLYISVMGKERGIDALLKSRYLTLGLLWKVAGRYAALVVIVFALYFAGYLTLGIPAVGVYLFLMIGASVAFFSLPFYVIYDFIRFIDLEAVERAVEFHPYRGERITVIAWCVTGLLIFSLSWSFGLLTDKTRAAVGRDMAIASARIILPYVTNIKTNLVSIRQFFGIPEIDTRENSDSFELPMFDPSERGRE